MVVVTLVIMVFSVITVVEVAMLKSSVISGKVISKVVNNLRRVSISLVCKYLSSNSRLVVLAQVVLTQILVCRLILYKCSLVQLIG